MLIWKLARWRQFSSITKRRRCTAGDATFAFRAILFICYCKFTYYRKTVAFSILRYNSSTTATTSKWYIPSAEIAASHIGFHFRSFGNFEQSVIISRKCANTKNKLSRYNKCPFSDVSVSSKCGSPTAKLLSTTTKLCSSADGFCAKRVKLWCTLAAIRRWNRWKASAAEKWTWRRRLQQPAIFGKSERCS
ncbi:unnamed protein product [Onchocerca flexuosa]|uniref:Secreted protein n=1 Tax=Onchocerca flexuosa TaxID=387005 RepID=A0A183HR63_9BILA|nr:unnamed protein product [Onchocerca flexuosa]